MTENEIKKCPKCGEELEKGVMQFSGLNPVVFWGEENIEESLMSQWRRTIDHRAWRCKKCQLAIFLYGEKGGVKP
jgi:NAD-dependent SIR2 family protein deacetylase